ncbi:hypothetical protein ACOSQ2_014733 [Xanthoceras sorbifolium]
MSSPGDQECHEANTGGPPNAGGRRSHPFDIAYERFMSCEKAKGWGDKTNITDRSEVIGSFTSGRMEVEGIKRSLLRFLPQEIKRRVRGPYLELRK